MWTPAVIARSTIGRRRPAIVEPQANHERVHRVSSSHGFAASVVSMAAMALSISSKGTSRTV
jgi:hypothetical protein